MTNYDESLIGLSPVEDDQMDNVAEWEMARALYADTFQYPIDKAEEWTKLIEGPNWIQAEGFKRMARRCREALESRNLQIVNRTPDRYLNGRPAVAGKPLEIQTRDELLAHIRKMEAKLQGDVKEALKAMVNAVSNTTYPDNHSIWAALELANAALTSQDNGGANADR
jgi:ATP-dependent exoDNAse (exonuclease V) alpha subunit